MSSPILYTLGGISCGLLIITATAVLPDLHTPKSATICSIEDLDPLFRGEAGKCENGNTVIFEPPQWGNERLPMFFITLACDMKEQIVFNNSSVVCTFTDKRMKKRADKLKAQQKENTEETQEQTTSEIAQ